MTENSPVVFLIDVDNTLLDNDAVLADLRDHMTHELGPGFWERYSTILTELWDELGYRDYLGAMQRYRLEHPHEPHLVEMAFFLADYPFASRLYPQALDALKHLQQFGPTVILSDGDVVFQPLKVRRTGIWDAVEANVLIYVHKERELEDVSRLYPADHYVLVDDKLRILTACKEIWGRRVTTIFPRQGHYAHDQAILESSPSADVTIEHIGDLLTLRLEQMVPSRETSLE